MTTALLTVPPLFLHDEQGNLLYFPYADFGRRRRGYVVGARHRRRHGWALLSRHAWLCSVFALSALPEISQVAVGWIVATILHVVSLGALTGGLCASPVPYDRERARRTSLHLVAPAWLWSEVSIAGLALAVGTGIWLFADEHIGSRLVFFSVPILAGAFLRTLALRRELAGAPSS